MSNTIAEAYEVLADVTTTISSSELQLGASDRTVHVVGTTTAGAGAATILVEVSNNTAYPWLTAATISLTLSTTAAADGVAVSAGWKNMRLRVSSISGTGAKVSGSIGV